MGGRERVRKRERGGREREREGRGGKEGEREGEGESLRSVKFRVDSVCPHTLSHLTPN